MSFLTIQTLLLTIARREFIKTVVAIPRTSGRTKSQATFSDRSESSFLQFYGDVDSDSCQNLIANLKSVDAEQSGFPIHLHIQSFGGDLMPMFHVLDCIDTLETPVWTYVDGYAASAASLLSVYGDKRFMTRRSFVLVHELRTNLEGSYSEITRDLEHSKDMMQMMCDVYKMKTKMNRNEIQRLMRKDMWLNANSCLKLGIVDTII